MNRGSQQMIFASDNWAAAAPEISKALESHSKGMATAYGESDLDCRVEALFSEIFETELSVFFVGTGTAANSLAMAATSKPGGVAFCHNEAHIVEDECGAPEFLSSGGRLDRVSGEHGKINPAALTQAIARYPKFFNHQGRATLVSITQASEIGSVYSCEEIAEISAIAHENELATHMDGARFANALVNLDVSPADMTWRSGIDLLSFGGTKNGCWCAEALVVFNPTISENLPYLRKRSGHLFSKTRFVSAQFEAYFTDGLWLDLANHSNAMARRLAKGIRKSNRARMAWESQSNLVFFVTRRSVAEELTSSGARFHPNVVPRDYCETVEPDECIYRLVASFATTEADVDEFLGLLG